ncbi:MAG: phosphate-starvation-inducible PsiE family protein [Gammaproteobacteria bacterium]
MKINTIQIFEKVIGVVLNVMLLFITLGIIIGVARLFMNLGDLLVNKDITTQYFHIISDVLTLFILIELSRSLVDYFTTHRLRMTFIVDAAIVFLLREIMIKLFEDKITFNEIYALSALLLVLGALRIGSIIVFQREKKMLDVNVKRDV